MFWVCYGEFKGSRRFRRTWIVEADSSPDEPDENGERAYPFNGMGGYVWHGYGTREHGYNTREEALQAESDLVGGGMMPKSQVESEAEMVGSSVVGGQVKVLFPDGTERMCRVGPTNAAGNTLVWVPVYGTWLKMWKSQELLKEIVPKGEVLLAESSFDPRLHRRCKVD